MKKTIDPLALIEAESDKTTPNSMSKDNADDEDEDKEDPEFATGYGYKRKHYKKKSYNKKDYKKRSYKKDYKTKSHKKDYYNRDTYTSKDNEAIMFDTE